jgi:hypothetical protein
MACDDDYTPPEAQAPLVGAAQASTNAAVIWTTGQHIKGGRSLELQQLLDIVLGGIANGTPPPAAGCEGGTTAG